MACCYKRRLKRVPINRPILSLLLLLTLLFLLLLPRCYFNLFDLINLPGAIIRDYLHTYLPPHELVILDETISINHSPLILLWTPLWAHTNNWKWAFPDSAKRQCPSWNCRVTANRTRLAESDVIVFAQQDMDFLDLPLTRTSNQIWVFYTREAPYAIRNEFIYSFVHYSNSTIFNWTITHRKDSTVSFGYARIVQNIPSSVSLQATPSKNTVPIDGHYSKIASNSTSDSTIESKTGTNKGILPPTAKNVLTNRPSGRIDIENDNDLLKRISLKKYDVAWFVSNCNTPSKRYQYARDLSNYITVHIYGKCGSKECSRDSESLCYNLVEKDYRFYLSFESSICKDYVTEKLFKILSLYTVPVVYGGANYSEVAPPGSVINIRDFKSPKELAQYLKYLKDNPREYMKYFTWKRSYSVVNDDMACRLCESLKRPFRKQYYNNIMSWWLDRDKCQNP